MSWLDTFLQTLINDFGLVAIFILSTVESACVPVPSEIVVPFGRVPGRPRALPTLAVVLVATAANLTGSLLAVRSRVVRWAGRSSCATAVTCSSRSTTWRPPSDGSPTGER